MAVRSRRVTDVVMVSPGGTNVYIVPAGRTLILRAVVAAGGTALNPTRLSLNVAVANGAFGVVAGDVQLGTVAWFHFQDDLILNPGDRLYGTSSVGNCSVVAFGSLLAGEPA